jgi:hypothetical protein
MDWIALAQVTDMLVNTVMNFQVPKMRGISWLVEELSALQEELYSKESVG